MAKIKIQQSPQLLVHMTFTLLVFCLRAYAYNENDILDLEEAETIPYYAFENSSLIVTGEVTFENSSLTATEEVTSVVSNYSALNERY